MRCGFLISSRFIRQISGHSPGFLEELSGDSPQRVAWHDDVALRGTVGQLEFLRRRRNKAR
jgi:hypothetical protein